ncbi:serine protease [Nocardia sp. 2]|uniref:Serine protease n=1 Tax=Nocardia acididurans TaxID=2802282 RepID=A0ABS1M566_9NOCA|nr:serine protease [Nocardia acididurans]MBL1075701.1 serine protease [Nocardia acididurans]
MSGVFPGAGRLEAAVARVLDGAGSPVGAGFVIGAGRIATCAHVIEAAVGAGRVGSAGIGATLDAGGVGTTVMVDFPMVAGAPRMVARVHRWEPVRADGRGDIALLAVADEEAGVLAPPPLWRAERPWGREFRAIGFPSELADGVWVWGEFRAAQGSGWLQLHGASGGQPITGGFSGSPVWDTGSAAVVGMAVAADRRRLTRTAFMIPVNEVLGIEPELLPNPYRGLEPFGENDSRFFYGRAADIDRVLEALRERPIAAVVGRSGIGKSSLVMAGIAARSRADGVRVEYLSAEANWEVPDLAPGEKTLLVADQFEELVATAPEVARDRLRALLDRAADPAVHVLLTLRWDVMEALADDDLAAVLDRSTVTLAPMGRDQLRQAIRGPATHAPGVDLDDDLVERLIDDTVGEPGGLPLLESVLTELWEHREGGRLTLADYERVGRAAGSIARRAERVYGLFPPAPRQLSAPPPGESAPDREPSRDGGPPPGPDQRAVRRLLTMLAAPRGDGFVRVPVSMRDLPELRTVAGQLARERLVVTGRGADDADVVELAHQSLIENWPRLREWLEHDRDFLAWQRRTERERRSWESQLGDDGGLLRGSALSAAEEWVARRPEDIPDPLRHYIAAGAGVRRREVRRWRVVTAVLAVVGLVAAGTAVLAYRTSAQRAEALRSLAGAALAEQSLQLAESQPGQALQLAQAAARLAPDDPKVESALLVQQLRLASATSVRSGLGRDIRLVAADEAGSVVVTGDSDGTVTVWPGLLDGGTDSWQLPIRNAVSLTMSGNGGKLATVNSLGGVEVWDLVRRTGPYRVHADAAITASGSSGAVDSNGATDAVDSHGGAGVAATEVAQIPPTAVSAKFSTDGARLVVSRDLRRSPLPVDNAKRVLAEVGDADAVEIFDTAADPPVRVGGHSAGSPADLLPLQVDSSSSEAWFHIVDARGEQRYERRAVDGAVVTPGAGDEVRGIITGCGDEMIGTVLVRESDERKTLGVGAGCLDVPSGAEVDRDETGRYLVISYMPEGTLFQLIHLVDTVTQHRYKVQARYQSTGRPGYLVRPGPDGPVLFVVGANDLTRHAPAARMAALTEFGAVPADMTWSDNARWVAEFHSSTKRLELREVIPQVRQTASVAVAWPAATENAALAVTADDRYLAVALDSHELHFYSLPDLRPAGVQPLPVPAEYQGGRSKNAPSSVIATRDGEVVVLHAGYVTRWNTASATAIGAPQQIWRDAAELRSIAELGFGVANGTVPGEILIVTRRAITVWDSDSGARVRVMASSATGWLEGVFKSTDIPTVFVWTERRRVERWNTATGSIEPVAISVPWAPYLELLHNGLLVAGWENGKVQIMDGEYGILVNAKMPAARARPQVNRVGDTFYLITDNGLLSLNLDRERILDRLCAVSARDFTAAERALLPPGAEDTPPCS